MERRARPTFAICGTFSGATESAAKWLKKFDLEMEDYRNDNGLFPAGKYLSTLDALLTGDASDWSESHPVAIRLLAEAETTPTDQTVENFRALFCERFPSKVMEVSPIPFDLEIASLRQRPEESLAAYYKRVSNMMQRVGVRDRPTPLPTATSLASSESIVLDTVLRAFIRGLGDPKLKIEATRGMASSDRSLRSIYQMAEEAHRTNEEIQKLHDEESKSDQLELYRNLIHQYLPKHQVDSLLASHHAAKQPQQFQAQQTPQYQPWPPRPEQPQPSYRSEDRPILAPNPSKGNANRGGLAGSNRRGQFQPTPKEIPERSTSKNPYINGTSIWSFKQDGQLCIKCGTPGHGSPSCDNLPLPAWEQSYLKMIVFGENPRANFAAVGFGEFDGAIKPYSESSSSTRPILRKASTSSDSKATGVMTPTSSVDSYLSSSSLQFGVAGLEGTCRSLPQRSSSHPGSLSQPPEVNLLEANYGEGSGPNKRPHMEEQPTSRPQVQPQQNPGNQMPGPLPYQNPVPQPQQASGPPQQNPGPSNPAYPTFPFQANTEDRTKQKGKKRVGKRSEPQPLVGLMNDQGSYDSPVSVRNVLQSTKVDMTWMDLVAWSPAVCKELKRLCTRVPKKRAPKPAKLQPQVQFQPTFMPQVPQMPSQPFPTMPYQPTQPAPVVHPHIDMNQDHNTQSTQSTFTGLLNSASITAATMEAEKHTRFLSTLSGSDKAFRVVTVVRMANGSEVVLEKPQTQADQGSEMNVISMGLVRMLGLKLQALADIGFKGLSMRTADHRDTVLEYWVWLHVAVEGVWRHIRCFVAPEVVSVSETGRSEYLGLILGIPWLYSVDAKISVRHSSLMVGDVTMGEEVREVIGPEMIFCREHNLIMYPKSAMVRALPKATVEEVSDYSESSDDDDGSTEEDEEGKPDFQ